MTFDSSVDNSLTAAYPLEVLRKRLTGQTRLLLVKTEPANAVMYFSILTCLKLGVLSIMPNRPVRDQWEFPSKMERHFPIKPGQPIVMTLATVCLSSEFPNKGKEPVCQKWNDKFRSEYSDRNKWTTSRGGPEYSGQKKPKRTFPFEFQPKFPESLA